MNSTRPLISVVVPVYNVEKYLRNCLDSILRQSYDNLEVICVNDASPDGSLEIIKEYVESDPRVRLVTYEKNRGLFHARLAGADIATGDYICFVDSDDTISLDWLRRLLEKALEENADMVLANTVQLRDGQYFIENNYSSLCFDRPPLEREEIFSTLVNNAGLCFAWHTVWNKLYSMALWNKARPEYESIQGHLIMAEDVAYSFVLYYYAQKMAFSNHEGYFYFRNEQASTNAFISLDRIKKHFSDVSRVFDFCENFMKKHGVFEKYEDSFNEFKDRNFRIQSNILYARGLWNDQKARKLLCDCFRKDKPELSHPNDFWFYEIKTTWENNAFYSEKLLREIADPSVDVVSFDLFDTLVMRPFVEPRKLLDFIAKKYETFFTENKIYNFVAKRVEAENACRTRLAMDANVEDCTLSEIYDAFAEQYRIAKDTAIQIKAFEEDTDYELSLPRKSNISLMKYAKQCGKKVIITSDIYYEKAFIERLLQKHGITCDDLFLSSEVRLLKATGGLYKYVQSKYHKQNILHIGDNWNSDILEAQSNGFKAQFIPSTKEIFEGIHADNYTGPALVTRTPSVLTFADLACFKQNLTLNATVATTQNRMFDKPFPSWNHELRYNANFYFMGNYVFGTEMLGLASYIYDVIKANGYKKVVFLARDGYLPKIAFDTLLTQRGIQGVETDYFHVSRRSLVPVAIEKGKNLSCLQSYIAIDQHTPDSIIELLQKYLVDTDALVKELKNALIQPEKKFSGQASFEKTIALIEKHFDYDLLARENKKLSAAMRQVFDETTLAFDLGYSGRIQSLISHAVGRPIDVVFLHSSGADAESIAEKNGFKIFSYLPFSPKITSVVREYFFSEIAPSCIGYEIENGEIKAVMDDSQYDYTEHFIQDEIVRGMKDFISDYCSAFAPYDFMFRFRSDEISIPFETFMNQIPPKDMWVFHCCNAEDKLYYNYSGKSLYDIWNYNINNLTGAQAVASPETYSQYGAEGSSYPITETYQFKQFPKWKKAVILFFTNHKLFWVKFKSYLKRKRYSDK